MAKGTEQLRQYVIYIHINPLDNNKVYIGLTKQKPQKRWVNGQGYKGSPYFYRAIQKYGWDNFQHKILFQFLTKQQAELKEKELIKQYQSTNPIKGYNIKEGGASGPRDFTKIIELLKNNKKFGENRYNSKKVKCIETNDIFGSICQAERWCNSTKVGECCRGERKHAGFHPKTKQQLSWCFANENEKVTILCHKEPNKVKRVKKIQCVETQQIYASASEASRKTGITTSNILRCCQGKRKSAGKLHWIYYIGE